MTERDRRASGVLVHPTSLPGHLGAGDLGTPSIEFVRFLARAGQRVWQTLPLGPAGAGYSPYDSVSSFAGSADLVSLEALRREGWLRAGDLEASAPSDARRANLAASHRVRTRALELAFSRFDRSSRGSAGLERFRADARWLGDYALFRALRESTGAPWWAWEDDLRLRRPGALARARRQLADRVRFHEFLQGRFTADLTRLRRQCRDHDVTLFGDVPMFVSRDSADVWANRELFDVDRQGRSQSVAGAPPDAFSASGQLWGNPTYRWSAHQKTAFRWWVRRLVEALAKFDVVRIDHFIGFVRCWIVPAAARTAKAGRFRPSPGAKILEALQGALRAETLPLVAEDLGLVTPAVHELRDRFELPGMRVLTFGLGDLDDDLHLPHRYVERAVAYTGTHDTDTVVGWYRGLGRRDPRDRKRRRRVLDYLGCPASGVHRGAVRAVQNSVARWAIVPMQDWLGLPSSSRMNVPGTPRGNWRFRLRSDDLSDHLAADMRALSEASGRCGA